MSNGHRRDMACSTHRALQPAPSIASALSLSDFCSDQENTSCNVHVHGGWRGVTVSAVRQDVAAVGTNSAYLKHCQCLITLRSLQRIAACMRTEVSDWNPSLQVTDVSSSNEQTVQ